MLFDAVEVLDAKNRVKPEDSVSQNYVHDLSPFGRIDGTAAFFIAHLVSSVIYHADGGKEKCVLLGGRPQGLVEWKDQNQPEILLLYAI